ncbi:hypothetical protein ACQPU1_10765 [Clostridium paraputrificum]|uniref:hypothetical protein n=1 Tax=Clostridium TaxID=1485 RepID=UPI003D32B9F3
MSKKARKPGDYMLFVVGILFISFMVNVYISASNYKSQYRVGMESYKNIENIRFTNESNIGILDTAIEIGSIDNMDVLRLYKNYGDISDSTINLWDDYSFYKGNKSLFKFKKNIETNKNTLVDINGKIEEYLLSILDREMKTQSSKIVLNGEILKVFERIKSLAEEINTYYTEFYSMYLRDVVDEERMKKIIKKYYWIDMLEGVNDINEKYIDMNFTS